jgi:hypothetical protein
LTGPVPRVTRSSGPPARPPLAATESRAQSRIDYLVTQKYYGPRGVSSFLNEAARLAKINDGIDALVAAAALGDGSTAVVLTSDPDDPDRLLQNDRQVSVRAV